MPKVGSYVSVCYRLADVIEDDRRLPTFGEVKSWKPPFQACAEVTRVHSDDCVDLAVYDNAPTKDNHSQLLGGITSATHASDKNERTTLNRWWQE